MLTDPEKETIVKCAKKYNISAVYAMSSPASLVLGIDGFDPRIFFRFYGELLRTVSVPVEVVDLSLTSLYVKLVEKEGAKIYG